LLFRIGLYDAIGSKQAGRLTLPCNYLLPVCVCRVQLATGGDANAVALADAYDWYFLPVVNADGYSYSWTNVSCIKSIFR
jgi:Zinc carboxypeptidase